MDLLNTIRAEIERRKKELLARKAQCRRSGLERIMHKIGAYNDILKVLDTLEQEPTPKIRGWVARDKDGTLYLFYKKPQKWNDGWVSDGDIDWHQLDSNLYPELTWSNKPIEVELEIHRV